MKFGFLISAILATVAVWAAPTWAGGPTKYDITLTIQATGCTEAGSGPCTGGMGLADYCPSDDCACCTFKGTASGAAGNGPVTLYETNNWGVGGGYGLSNTELDPAYAEIDIHGSKDVEAIYFEGAALGQTLNSDSPSPEGILSGGCVIEDATLFKGGGFAKCGGDTSGTTKTKFTITGTAEK
jgi:hypothetical protein